MHDPVGSNTTRGSTFVIYQCLLHSDRMLLRVHCSIFACSLPVTSSCCSVSSGSIWVLSISWTVEIPLHIFARQEWLLCSNNIYIYVYVAIKMPARTKLLQFYSTLDWIYFSFYLWLRLNRIQNRSLEIVNINASFRLKEYISNYNDKN